ncbi:LysR family transcriptional regulator [Pseudophaeobacter sp.]|uniref:LysR family transcriptional regulator n=1 Tax=Pseudophaeobacter sp. TaxID=1971739 RepID=UPI00405A073D
MNLTRIQYFLSLAKTLNFSETARICGMSQPALSKAIRKLEEELGGALLRREGRLTHLTPLGRAMAERLGEVEQARRRAEATAKRLVAPGRARLQIALMCTIGVSRFLPFLAKVQRKMPEAELILSDTPVGEIETALLSGHCDLAVLAAPFGGHARLRHTELYREDMVAAVARNHRLAALEDVTLSTLAEQPYIERTHCEFGDLFYDQCEAAGVEIIPAIRSNREDWVTGLVANGHGVTLMPEDSGRAAGLACCQITPVPLWRSVSLAVATGREDDETVRAILTEARSHDWLAAT